MLECSHKDNVTNVYWNTSLRPSSHSLEMNNQLLAGLFIDIFDFAQDMEASALETRNQQNLGNSVNKQYLYDFMKKHWDKLPSNITKPSNPSFSKPQFAKSTEVVFSSSGCTYFTNNDVANTITNFGDNKDYSKRLEMQLHRYVGYSKISLISSVVCIGSRSSVYTKEILHCTFTLSNNASPNFSYVQLLHDSKMLFGRIAAITEVYCGSKANYILDVALLKPISEEIRNKYYKFAPFDIYCWDYCTIDTKPIIKIESFPLESIIDHTKFEGCMNTSASTASLNVVGDKEYDEIRDYYVHIPRQFYERIGTEVYRGIHDLYKVNIANCDDAKNWIRSKSAKGSNIPSIKFPDYKPSNIINPFK